jgi:hypothetical protein
MPSDQANLDVLVRFQQGGEELRSFFVNFDVVEAEARGDDGCRP